MSSAPPREASCYESIRLTLPYILEELESEKATLSLRRASRRPDDEPYFWGAGGFGNEGWYKKSLPTFSVSPTRKLAGSFYTDPRKRISGGQDLVAKATDYMRKVEPEAYGTLAMLLIKSSVSSSGALIRLAGPLACAAPRGVVSSMTSSINQSINQSPEAPYILEVTCYTIVQLDISFPQEIFTSLSSTSI